MKILLQLHYLPCIAYFTAIAGAETIYVDTEEIYQKQSYRNRAYILSANKVDRLSVPVRKGSVGKPIREVEIDYKEKWQNRHWRAIASSYGKAPYFEYYAPYFREIIYTPYNYLYELNVKLLTLCQNFLGFVEFTDSVNAERPINAIDSREIFHPKQSTILINEVIYPQLFGKSFHNNLSIIDLLFAEGPAAAKILKGQKVAVLTES